MNCIRCPNVPAVHILWNHDYLCSANYEQYIEKRILVFRSRIAYKPKSILQFKDSVRHKVLGFRRVPGSQELDYQHPRLEVDKETKNLQQLQSQPLSPELHRSAPSEMPLSPQLFTPPCTAPNAIEVAASQSSAQTHRVVVSTANENQIEGLADNGMSASITNAPPVSLPADFTTSVQDGAWIQAAATLNLDMAKRILDLTNEVSKLKEELEAIKDKESKQREKLQTLGEISTILQAELDSTS